MSDDGSNGPPPEALGDDRPSDNEDALEETAREFQMSPPTATLDAGLEDSDDESLLSEVDEAQFADFDATAVQIAPDLETLTRTIKASKRKRVEGEEPKPKKRKAATREKAKKNRRRVDSDDGFSGGEEIEGKRSRKSKPGTDGPRERRKKTVVEEINDDDLTPEERRRRALDRAMDAALKKNTTRRVKKGEIDLEKMADEEVVQMRERMTAAAEADGEAVTKGQPASAKLRLLPEVLALLNRNSYVQAVLDPESNLLEGVRFFLEPLVDGSLPAYNIQRDLLAALAKLPITKETLIASGIGKVVMFYKKSKRTEPAIKRQATKLMEEWSRPILARYDDYSKKQLPSMAYDPSQPRRFDPSKDAPVLKARSGLAPGEKVSNRARIPAGASHYEIVPESRMIARR